MEIKKVTTYPESKHILKNHVDISDYINGGHGVVTLQAPSGNHHTYLFKKPHSSSKFKEGTLFVYCFDGKSDCGYVGMWDTRNFRKTTNSEYEEDTDQFKGAKYIMYMSMKDFDTPMKLYHEGVCCRCGRQLTTPESIERGMGPVCKNLGFTQNIYSTRSTEYAEENNNDND